MVLDPVEATSDGIERIQQRNGLLLIALAFPLQLATSVGTENIIPRAQVAGNPIAPDRVGPSIDPALAAVVLVASFVGIFVLQIVGYRVFTSEETETIPRETYTENMGVTFLNIFVGGIVYLILVLIGTILFILPGILFLVSLFFFGIYVAVEGENFVVAHQKSWNLTSGNRWSVLGLFLILIAFSFVANFFQSSLTEVIGFGGLVVGSLLSAAVFVAFAAISSRAYVQLSAGDDEMAEL